MSPEQPVEVSEVESTFVPPMGRTERRREERMIKKWIHRELKKGRSLEDIRSGLRASDIRSEVVEDAEVVGEQE